MLRRFLVLFLLLCLLAVPVLPVQAQPTTDWPMHRGDPSRDGAVDGVGLEGDPVLLWQVKLPGRAARSPAISQGLAFVGSGDGEMRALDAATGEQRWSFTADSGVEITPTWADGLLYFGSLNGTLYALDASTGASVWRAEIQAAPNSTPVVVDGVLYVGSEANALMALDAATGEELWRFATDAPIPRSPSVVGNLIVTGTENGLLLAVDATTHEKLWEFQGDPNELVGAVPVADGVVYFPQAMMLWALDAQTGEVLWERDVNEGGVRCALPFERIVVTCGFNGQMTGLDARTGDTAWTTMLGGASSPAALVDGVVYTVAGDRQVVALDARDGADLWRFSLDGDVEYGPHVANGVLYVSTTFGNVYALTGSENDLASRAMSATPVSQGGVPSLAPASAATPDVAASLETIWRGPGNPEQPLFAVSGFAADADGNLWVVDAGNNQIQILTSEGEYLETWDGTAGGERQFRFALTPDAADGDLDFDEEGNIYVVDPGLQQVRVFAPDRTPLRAWGTFGQADGQFVKPSSLAISNDEVYVSDMERDDIQVFSLEGEYRRTIGEHGSGVGQLNEPGYVSIDPEGNVWVSDFNNRVTAYTPDGEFLTSWGEYGTAPGQFDNPIHVAVDSQGHVFVTDFENGRLQGFTLDGTLLGVWSLGQTPGGSPNWPYTVMIAKDGDILIAGTAPDKISESSITKFASPLE